MHHANTGRKTLSGERLQTRSAGQRQYFMYAWMERQPQLGEIRVNLVEVGESMRPGTGIVELGERHPIARELAGVLLARRSLNYEYVTRAEGIMFAPEHVTPTVLEHELAVHAAVHTEAAESWNLQQRHRPAQHLSRASLIPPRGVRTLRLR